VLITAESSAVRLQETRTEMSNFVTAPQQFLALSGAEAQAQATVGCPGSRLLDPDERGFTVSSVSGHRVTLVSCSAELVFCRVWGPKCVRQTATGHYF
jgi:hypothetical protein